MPKPIFTGNALLDKLASGPYVNNPNYNPKTKAGRSQPSVLVNTAAGEVHGGAVSKTSEATRKIAYTFNDTGADLEQIKRDEELGITYSPYNTEEELNHARSEKQSAAAQFGNFVERAVYGEMVLGTLEGLGDIVDGVANIATQGDWGQSGWSKYWQDVKQENEDKHKIYQYNPGESFAWNDFGWWMENAVSTATTVSLMLPAAGWAKAIGLAGKVTNADKALNWATRGISKGILRAASKAPLAKEFSALKNIDNTANKMTNLLKANGEIMGTAFLSRSGENMMEANQTYQETYESSKKNLDSMNDIEFTKLVQRNPEFANMSKDDIAKEIAKKSMMKTFYNDYWMLAMDIPQYKALGSLWKGTGMRATSIGERIAAENVKRKLAGKTEEELIKNTFKNRLKYDLVENIKNPLSTWGALELGEGFEEGFQGIQQEKGKAVASKYFDPNFTERSLNSYLNDSSIWEQAFWGAVGGIVFKHAGKAVKSGIHKAEAAYKKKYMTADEYEKWKKTDDEIAIAELNGITSSAAQFAQEMSDINDGKNPYEYKRDVSTGMPIIKNDQYQNAELNEDEKELLKQDALRKFIDNMSFTAIDRGNFDLVKDIIGSTEFDKYLKDKGTNITENDNLLSQQIVRRMNMIDTYYSTAISNFNALNDKTNPYATRAAAQDVARKQLNSDELDEMLNNIEYKLGQITPKDTDYSRYSDKELYGKVNKIINQIVTNNAEIEEQYKNKQISKSVRDTKINQNNKYINSLTKFVANNTEKGMMEDVKTKLKNITNNESLAADFNKWYSDYLNFVNEQFGENPYDIPGKEVDNTLSQKHQALISKVFVDAEIPINQKDFTNIYNEYIDAFDQYRQNKLNSYIEDIKKYLKDAENLDEAIDKLYAENTGNKSLDKKIMALKFGYADAENQMYSLTNAMRHGKIQEFIKELKGEQNKAQASSNDAAEKGDLPSEKELTPDPETKKEDAEQKQEEEPREEMNLSTGEETQQTQVVDDAEEGQPNPNVVNQLFNALQKQRAKKEQPTQIEEEQPQLTQAEKEDNNLITEEEKVNVLSNSLSGNKQTQKINIDEDDVSNYKPEDTVSFEDIEKYNFDNAIGSIIDKTFFTDGNLLKSIIKDYENGNKDSLIKYIDNLIKNIDIPEKYYDWAVSRIIYNIVSKINSYKELLSDPQRKARMGELAKAIIFKVDEKTASKYSNTEILNGAALNEVIENFLANYSIWIDNNTQIDENGNPKNIINLNDLFTYLLEDDSISTQEIEQVINNMFEYIATQNGNKYIFTGLDVLNNKDNYEQYLNMLRQEKQKIIAERNQLHIGMLKNYSYDDINNPKQIDNIPDNYNDILIKVARGEANVTCRFDEKSLHVIYEAHYTDEDGTKRTSPIAIMATINMSPDGNRYMPKRAINGFTNVAYGNNGTPRLNNYNFFINLINHDDANFKELFDAIANYFYNQVLISAKANKKLINIRDANAELIKLRATVENSVRNNEIFKQVVNPANPKYIYNLYGLNEEKDHIINFVEDVGSILFFDLRSKGTMLNSGQFENAHFDKKTMLESFKLWNESVYQNYKYTYELQKKIEDANSSIDVNVNIPLYILPNTLKEGEPRINIGDNTHSPSTFVYIDSNHHMRNEKNEDLGVYYGDAGVYSMGFLVYNKDGTKYIDFIQNRQQLNKEVNEKLKQYFINTLVAEQFNKDKSANATETFENLGKKFADIFGGNQKEHDFKTLYHFGNVHGSFSTVNGLFRLYQEGTDKILMTIYKYDVSRENQTKTDVSTAIKVVMPDTGEHFYINGNDYKWYKTEDKDISTDEDRNKKKIAYDKFVKLNKLINYIFDDVSFNKTTDGFTGTTKRNGSTIFNKSDGKFHTTFDNQTYNNYADFLIKNRAFDSNLNGHKGFVKGVPMAQRMSVNLSYKEKPNLTSNNAVSDILFNDNITRKTIPTKDVLKAAGVNDDVIKTLNKFVTKVVIPVDSKDEDTTRAFYKKNNKGGIYITQQGAMEMNGQPINAIRIILHENIHRALNNKKEYNQRQYNRIINDIDSLKQYTLTQLQSDIDNTDNQNEKQKYQNIYNLLNKYNKNNSTKEIEIEEFIAESLTQPVIIKYLNNTNYKESTNIDEIAQNKKSILQKLMDILLNLFEINDNINKSSILAKEYEILGNKLAVQNDISSKKTKVNRTKKKMQDAQANQANKEKTVKTNNSPVKGTFQLNDTLPAYREETKDDTIETIDSNIEKTISNDTSVSPINTTVNLEQLNEAEKTINKIEEYFESRVKRSDNFAEDHTYYLDDNIPIDTSVTQSIHGKKEIDPQWGVIASTLGNTVDDSCRLYFDNRQELIDDNHVIPNYNESFIDIEGMPQMPNSKGQLINDIRKIEKYLDNKFGAGHYKVITREFPIAGRIKINGEFSTVAGTMDMVVITDDGNIHIYDFKTNRINNNTNEKQIMNPTKVEGYAKQLNIYKQLIVHNFPELKDKVKIEGLIVFNTEYPAPSNTIKYSKNVNNEILVNGDKLLNSGAYKAPYFTENFEEDNFISIQDITGIEEEIADLPVKDKIEEKINDNDAETEASDNSIVTTESLDEEDLFNDNVPFADTELLQDTIDTDVFNNQTDVEIYVNAINQDNTNDSYGIQFANNMDALILSYPAPFRDSLQRSLANNELQYVCS